MKCRGVSYYHKSAIIFAQETLEKSVKMNLRAYLFNPLALFRAGSKHSIKKRRHLSVTQETTESTWKKQPNEKSKRRICIDVSISISISQMPNGEKLTKNPKKKKVNLV